MPVNLHQPISEPNPHHLSGFKHPISRQVMSAVKKIDRSRQVSFPRRIRRICWRFSFELRPASSLEICGCGGTDRPTSLHRTASSLRFDPRVIPRHLIPCVQRRFRQDEARSTAFAAAL